MSDRIYITYLLSFITNLLKPVAVKSVKSALNEADSVLSWRNLILFNFMGSKDPMTPDISGIPNK